MKLLALPTSPYAARVLIQVYEKGLDLRVEHPQRGIGPQQHAALNPMGRTPILLVGEQIIIESAAIQEYLEDLYPDPPLRGSDALETAKMRAFIRAVDLYLFPGIYGLRAMNTGDAALQEALQALGKVLDDLQKLFGEQGYVCGEQLTLADCTLVPACYYLERFFSRYGQESAFVGRPVLQKWRDTVNQHESVQRVTEQLTAALGKPA